MLEHMKERTLTVCKQMGGDVRDCERVCFVRVCAHLLQPKHLEYGGELDTDQS